MPDDAEPTTGKNAAATLKLIESLRSDDGELDAYREALAETALTLARALDDGMTADRLATTARAHLEVLKLLAPEGQDDDVDPDADLSSPVRDSPQP